MSTSPKASPRTSPKASPQGARAAGVKDESIAPALLTAGIILGGLYFLSRGPSSQAEWNRAYGDPKARRRYASAHEEYESAPGEHNEKYGGSWRDRAAMALGMKSKWDYEEEAARDAYLAKRARGVWAERGSLSRAGGHAQMPEPRRCEPEGEEGEEVEMASEPEDAEDA